MYKGQTKEKLLEIAELIKQKRFSFDQAEVGGCCVCPQGVVCAGLHDLEGWRQVASLARGSASLDGVCLDLAIALRFTSGGAS